MNSLLLMSAAVVGLTESPMTQPFVQAVREHYEWLHLRTASAVVRYSSWPSTERARLHGEWYSYIHAYEPGKEHLETFHFGDNPLITSTNPDDEDPLHNVIIRKDKINFQVYTQSGTVAINKDVSTFSRAVHLDSYFAAIGLPSPEGRPFLDALPAEASQARKGLPVFSYDYYFPYALRDPNWIEVGSEVVEGAECKVITRTNPSQLKDTLWIDDQTHFAIRRRRFETESEAIELDASDFKVFAKRIALPQIVELRTRASGATRFKLNDFAPGSPDPSMFEFWYPDGAIIHDNLRGKGRMFAIPGGEDILERFVNRVRRYLHSPNLSGPQSAFRQFIRQWIVPLAPSGILAIWFLMKLHNKSSG